MADAARAVAAAVRVDLVPGAVVYVNGEVRAVEVFLGREAKAFDEGEKKVGVVVGVDGGEVVGAHVEVEVLAARLGGGRDDGRVPLNEGGEVSPQRLHAVHRRVEIRQLHSV